MKATIRKIKVNSRAGNQNEGFGPVIFTEEMAVHSGETIEIFPRFSSKTSDPEGDWFSGFLDEQYRRMDGEQPEERVPSYTFHRSWLEFAEEPEKLPKTRYQILKERRK